MSVFKKLKDVLFDIEEEIPVITKEEKNEETSDNNPIKEIRMPVEEKEIVQEIPAKEEKVENKFNFPFDLEEEIPVRNRERDYFEEEPVISSRTSLREKDNYYNDLVESKHDDYEYDYSRLNISDTKKEEKKTFKISPIISPVYGILDQNYTKDDVIVRSESNKNPSLDEVRKKAYGSKKKVQKEEEKDEFEEPLKTLDEILIDKEENTKEITIKKESNVEDEIEYLQEPEIVKKSLVEEEPVYDDELPDEPYADEVVPDESENEIESDLFNLIDSMYEERNEREAEE